MQRDEQWQVVVVGAGAAGLLAATRAAERGRRTLLLEKNRKPGAKILMSGGTRCNITHDTDRRGIVNAFGAQGRFLHSALAALSPPDLVALIEAEGVLTKVEETGKVFPVSDQAADVLAALLRRLHRSGCDMAWNEPLLQLDRAGDGFALTTSQRVLAAENVIVTTGGRSYPGCGTSGDGYGWLAAVGHKIVPPRPALTPITTNAPWVAALRGVTIPDVVVRVVKESGDRSQSQAGKGHIATKVTRLAEARGSFLFTHFGLSGPAVLDVSRAVTADLDPRALLLECDFLPAVPFEELDDYLRRQSVTGGKKQVASILAGQIPKRFAEAIQDQLGLAGVRVAELTREQRRELIATVKQHRISVSGTRGFKKAEVTAGGVVLTEVDSRTMQSKLVPNLFLAGEILDLDGPIGGYNFQAAFSTAWLAGAHV